MIRSMTGYSLAEGNCDGYYMQVEIRTVNHRFCEMSVRMPREWLVWEDGIKRTIQPFVKRGRIEVSVTLERLTAAGRTVEVDWALVEAYRDAAEQLRHRLGLPESELLTLTQLLQLPDLIVVREHGGAAGAPSNDKLEDALLDVAREAAKRLVVVREAEGAHLSRDIAERIGALEHMQREVVGVAPAVAVEYRAKLTQRLNELLGDRSVSGVQDEARLTMEVAMLAERSDIQEELTRLDSHFVQCRLLLQADEPIGRKLDFYIQEMNREVNTIGSKANRVDIVNQVVEMKAELEKMREQAQNIE